MPRRVAPKYIRAVAEQSEANREIKSTRIISIECTKAPAPVLAIGSCPERPLLVKVYGKLPFG